MSERVKDVLFRAIKTFLETAGAYLLAHLTGVNFFEGNPGKTFWIGLALTLIASFAGAAAGDDPNWAISLVVALLNLAVTVINCVSMYWLARSFGKGTGYTIGLILLEPLFMILLGFGDAEYIGNASEMY